jgi:hypothetical protein
VGGIELSEWADGVVRYQGGCCPRHRPRHVTHQGYHTTGISRDQQANALSAFINRTNGTKAQWKIATRNNKKEKGPGVGSAQYRSFGPAWWHRLRSQRQTLPFKLQVPDPTGKTSKREKLRRKLRSVHSEPPEPFNSFRFHRPWFVSRRTRQICQIEFCLYTLTVGQRILMAHLEPPRNTIQRARKTAGGRPPNPSLAIIGSALSESPFAGRRKIEGAETSAR